VETPCAPSSSSNEFTPSVSESVAVMSDGVEANASGGNWKRSEDAANNKMNN
jgi:hypothetical protein